MVHSNPGLVAGDNMKITFDTVSGRYTLSGQATDSATLDSVVAMVTALAGQMHIRPATPTKPKVKPIDMGKPYSYGS